MSKKTFSKRVSLAAVSALVFGLISVVTAPTANAVACGAGSATTPWVASTTAFGAPDCGATNARTSVTLKQLAGVDNFVTLTADQNTSTTSGSAIKVTGGTVFSAPTNANGTISADRTQIVYSADTISGNTIIIKTPTAGTITTTFSTRAVVNGVVVDTVTQTFTITVVDRRVVSAAKSTSYIETYTPYTNNGTDGVWTSDPGDASNTADEVIYQPKGTVSATAPAVSFTEARITLNDSAGVLLDALTGTLPTVRAVVRSGPGTLSFGGTVGRDVTAVTTEFATATVNSTAGVRTGELTLIVFQDGTSGVSTIDIYVNGALWTTETTYFYGPAATTTTVKGKNVNGEELAVAPINSGLTASAWGCSAASCAGSTVSATAPAVVTVKDVSGVNVPYATLTATSSDTTVFASSSSYTMTSSVGVYNADISVAAGATSGKTASVTWAAATGTASAPLSWSTGGAVSAIKLTVAAKTVVGEESSMTLALTDASGNKAYDDVHSVTLTSDISITVSAYASSVTQNGNPASVFIVNGSSTWKFFNPLVPATVNLTAKIGTATSSASFGVSNAAIDDALAAAQEAIDAANAATDAANLAAEAADAATVAAEEARDAADAATAAIEELAQQVATLMAALRAQLKTLANTVAKIAKKVKA